MNEINNFKICISHFYNSWSEKLIMKLILSVLYLFEIRQFAENQNILTEFEFCIIKIFTEFPLKFLNTNSCCFKTLQGAL